MEADDKPFACSFAGCNMRFTNEDHLTVHKKKHDMVLNLGNGQKTNVFVADQTPTPTRFIRNCEEVGLFQDLQNVNPFEETFRKAVEASKTGVGLLHEVDSLSVPTGTDDTLHTPNVFPHIAEDSTSDSSSAYKSVATPFIASACVITENGRKKPSLCSEGSTSPATRRELDQLLHPTSTTGDVECHREIITGSIPEERRVVELGSSTKVVRQEADTSQHQETSRQVVTVNTENKNGLEVGTLSPEPPAVTPSQASSSAGGNTVQLLLRMPDGKLLQLSALPVEPVTPSGVNQLMQQQSQVEPQPVPTQNATVVLTTPGPTPVVTSVPDVTPEKCKNPTPAVKMSSSPIKQSTGLSLAKLRLKQTLISNNRTAATVKESVQKQSSAKVSRSEVSKTVSETYATSPASITPARRASSSSGNEDPGEKRQKFLERNRAAAMRCREKRKTWIQELERRAEEMLATNQQLQSEVASLRKEVADLKTLLLAHKDCPVTQAMAQGSSVPPSSAAQPEQHQIIALRNTNCLLPSTQLTTSAPLVQQHHTTVPHNQLILINGSSSLKRGSSESTLTPRKKVATNQGPPIIRQALLLPSTQAENIHVINSSAVKTVRSMNKGSQGVRMAVQSGVLVTNPILTGANQLSISAVIQNSNYRQTFIVPKICLPASVTPDVTDIDRVSHGNKALTAEADAYTHKKVGVVSDNEIGSHVIKINPNVMRKSTDSVLTHELTTNIGANSDADSDVEIIAEIQSVNERR